jgi:hypothetical protein
MILVASQSKAWVYGRSLVRTVGSTRAGDSVVWSVGDIYVGLITRQEVLPSVVYLCVIMKPR